MVDIVVERLVFTEVDSGDGVARLVESREEDEADVSPLNTGSCVGVVNMMELTGQLVVQSNVDCELFNRNSISNFEFEILARSREVSLRYIQETVGRRIGIRFRREWSCVYCLSGLEDKSRTNMILEQVSSHHGQVANFNPSMLDPGAPDGADVFSACEAVACLAHETLLMDQQVMGTVQAWDGGSAFCESTSEQTKTSGRA